MTTPRFSPAAAARAQAARRATATAVALHRALGLVQVCPPALAQGGNHGVGTRLAVTAARRRFFAAQRG